MRDSTLCCRSLNGRNFDKMIISYVAPVRYDLTKLLLLKLKIALRQYRLLSLYEKSQQTSDNPQNEPPMH